MCHQKSFEVSQARVTLAASGVFESGSLDKWALSLSCVSNALPRFRQLQLPSAKGEVHWQTRRFCNSSSSNSKANRTTTQPQPQIRV